MKRSLRSWRLVCALCGLCALPMSAAAQVNILTQHNDNQRTGANLSETTLNTANVNVGQFGKLFSRSVDGHVYAQPLYISSLNIGGKTRNVVFVATTHNSVYAFDADDPAASTPLWKRSLGASVPVPNDYFGNRYGPYHDIQVEIGIVSTPVIDLPARTLYCVAFTQDAPGGPYHQRLHALDILTGLERFGSPVEFGGSVPGTGYGQDVVDGIPDRSNGQIVFSPMQTMQRPALLLANGILYIAFAPHADTDPYHGWVFAYDTLMLQPRGLFCITPNGNEGGIWMSGQGPATDDNGNIYLMTGNGSYDGVTNWSDSFLNLHLSDSGLGITDWFTPYNQAALEQADADLGVSGPLLIPETNLMVGGGKEGRLYLLDRASMGQYNPAGDTQIVQWFWAYSGPLYGSPVYWRSPAGPLVCLWSVGDHLKAYRLNNGQFDTTPFAQSAMAVPGGLPGAMLSVSASGSAAGSGILWATHPFSGNANGAVRPGIVRAFDASTLQELWNSRQNEARDDVGSFGKFCYPTIANGKVYIGTFSNQLVVYGLGDFLANPVISPGGGAFYPSVSVRISEATSGAVVRYTTNGGDPTTASALYTGPFTLTNSATVKAKAFKSGHAPGDTVRTDFFLIRPGSTLGINFVGGGGHGDPAPMAASEKAGVLATAGWNNAAVQNGSLAGLAGDNGAGTDAGVSWACDNLWSLNVPETAGNFRLMKGYLDTRNANPTTVQITGLPAAFTATPYDVYVYCDGDNGGSRTGQYTVGATTISLTDPGGVDFSGTFQRADSSAGNYIVFTGVTGSSFTLTATPGTASDGVLRAPVNALQIVSHPVVNISGIVTLDGSVNAAQPITFVFRPFGGGTTFTRTQTLAANGSFRLTKVPIGNYSLAVKGSKWLQKAVAVTAVAGDVSGVTATLLPGDVHEDNTVDIADLIELADAFFTSPGDPLWNENADLNGNGSVDVTDLSLLADNFFRSGDP